MNQHEWVYGCYQHYLENHIEPGNPEDGVWEKAHWPVPKCKGGSKTILLLKQHHAVHGVLQCEEWQYPCLYGWEADYLEGELLTLCKKWQAAKGYALYEATLGKLTPEEISVRAKNIWAQKTPEERKEHAQKSARNTDQKKKGEAVKKGHAKRDPEAKQEAIEKAKETYTPEKRREAGRKAQANIGKERKSEIIRQAQAKRSPKERRQSALKAWETRRARRASGELVEKVVDRAEAARKGHSKRTPAERKESALKAAATRRANQAKKDADGLPLTD
jgi:hypothetical protein